MDCSHVRMLLWFARDPDKDLDAADLGGLREHLALCGDCRRRSQEQWQVDRVIGQGVRDVATPAHLKDRISNRLRDARRWGWKGWTATAASMLFAVGMTTAWALWPAPYLDSTAIAEIKTGSAPEKVEAWFSYYDVPFAWPAEFNSTYLDYYEIVELQGQRVAKLSFRAREFNSSTDSIAHVYAIADSQFQLEDEASQPLTVRRYADVPGFAFLVTLAGGRLDTFLRRGV